MDEELHEEALAEDFESVSLTDDKNEGKKSKFSSAFQSVKSTTTSQSRGISRLKDRYNEKKAQNVQKREDEYLQYLERAHSEDFSDIEKYNFLYQPGYDNMARPIIVVIGCNLPAKEVSLERVMLYTMKIMDKIVESDYVLLYLHTNFSKENQPTFQWLKKVYTIFNRKYKKNLKSLYMVHPSSYIKMTFKLFKPFISNKFWKKLRYLEEVDEIFEHLDKEQLQLPPKILRFQKNSVPMFGASLVSVMSRDDHKDASIPVIIEQCLMYLAHKGIEVEGIFRVSGNQSEVQDAKQSFDIAGSFEFDNCSDPHCVAGLLKLYLRELPNPLFPFELYKSFLVTHVKSGDKISFNKDSLEGVLRSLPDVNQKVVRRLFDLLQIIHLRSSVNKMTASNLAIVFAPNILRNPDTQVDTASMGDITLLREAPITNALVSYLIQNSDTVFPF